MDISAIRFPCLLVRKLLSGVSQLREKAIRKLSHLNAELLSERRFKLTCLICYAKHNSYFEYHISKECSHLTYFKVQHKFSTNKRDAKWDQMPPSPVSGKSQAGTEK